jgi:transcriptional regulator NrdR family protein
MRCPHCDSEFHGVVDVRPNAGENTFRRRRECHKCGRRWTTREVIDPSPVRGGGKSHLSNMIRFLNKLNDTGGANCDPVAD